MINENKWELDAETNFLKEMISKNKEIFKNAGGSCENFFSKIKLVHSKRVFGQSSSLKFIINEDDFNNAITMMIKYNSETKPKMNYDYFT